MLFMNVQEIYENLSALYCWLCRSQAQYCSYTCLAIPLVKLFILSLFGIHHHC